MTEILKKSIAPHIAINAEKIEAIDMTVNPINCNQPCGIIITITWQNTSNGPKKFRPGITVNDELIRLSEITLPKGETITITFNLNDLVEGTYIICPDPN